MKNTITELLRELALTATSISTNEAYFLETIAELDVMGCEDIAGTVGTLAACFLAQCGKRHFREFREETSSN
jgi:hypothetical protein